jgi:hypothetical protein
MKKTLIAISSVSMLFLGGCEGSYPTKGEAVASGGESKAEMKAEAKPELTEDAKTALAQAQADVKAAKAKKALWTTSDEALKKAESATAEFDSKAVIKNAKVASEQAKLGIEQTSYPVTTNPPLTTNK